MRLSEPVNICLEPIGTVVSTRSETTDDYWDKEQCFVELLESYGDESLLGLSEFSHAEIIFYMDQVDPGGIENSARHPRGREDWPKTGIFAQRAKNRTNQIGITVCKISRLTDNRLYIEGLDAVDGTPVLDIKPWVQEFGPRGPVRQPTWMTELMKNYWA